jgi:hypothetical protein
VLSLAQYHGVVIDTLCMFDIVRSRTLLRCHRQVFIVITQYHCVVIILMYSSTVYRNYSLHNIIAISMTPCVSMIYIAEHHCVVIDMCLLSLHSISALSLFLYSILYNGTGTVFLYYSLHNIIAMSLTD